MPAESAWGVIAAKLIINTVKAAISVSSGKAVAAGCLSSRAIALAEESMAGVLGCKAKAVLLMMILGLAVGGVGLAGTGGSAPAKAVPAPSPPSLAKTQTPQPKAVAGVQEKTAPFLDNFGDSLPVGATRRLGTHASAMIVPLLQPQFHPTAKSWQRPIFPTVGFACGILPRDG